MSRRIFGKAVTGLAILLAFAAAAQPAPVPAPERNVETRLAFPDKIGPARKSGSIDYSQTKAAPELGWAWHYETPRTVTTFFIYNLGISSIPPGATGGAVLTQFQQAVADMEVATQVGGYEQLKRSQGPGNCTIGAIVFRCITFTAVLPRDKFPVFSRLYLTGYRNYFLKIRQDWPQNSPDAAREADAVIQAFASTIQP
jgi:hypothetical protein